MKKGDIVILINDPKKELFTLKSKTGRISTGPNNQFDASPVWDIEDKKGVIWCVREDLLQLKTK